MEYSNMAKTTLGTRPKIQTDPVKSRRQHRYGQDMPKGSYFYISVCLSIMRPHLGKVAVWYEV